ncbi:uncharacterized protein I303_104513 [Kwoniella dejecticola CBS 10117]|uniref:Phosphoglycerate mutase n=1 Tax=Kwoniella dejecticola CBS 10117 TaxID=1296121 RepID=A0AAJ8MI58_9TREE
MSAATTKRLYLVRHAQAEHNLAEEYFLPDAPLTDLGRMQSQELCDRTKETIQKTAELIVSSPLRRTMETMLIGFKDLKERLDHDKEGQGVILLELLREVDDWPCNTPLYPVSVLKASNDGIFASLDFSTLSEDYASQTGILDPVNAAERAKQVRRWLRDRPEKEIVVVAHGTILGYIVDGHRSDRNWENVEVKTYTFLSDDDEEALLSEIEQPVQPLKEFIA